MKKYMQYLGCCVLGVLFVACRPNYDFTPTSGDARSDVEQRVDEVLVTIPYSQTRVVPQSNLSITFGNVLEDSRCPKGAECVWEGNAKIRLLLQTLPFEKLTMAELNTHVSYPTSVTYDGYEIHLHELLPYPVYGMQIQPQDYKVTVKVVKK